MGVPNEQQKCPSLIIFTTRFSGVPKEPRLFSMPSLHPLKSTPRTLIMNWCYLGDILEDTWLLQGLSVLGSIVLTSVLVVLLARFDNTPILEWNGISLNAVVALIATMLKGLVALTVSDCLGQAKWIWFSRQRRSLSDFVIIDQGSRGPLESVKLLRKPVARSFIDFDAILIILSVPMDSFVQLTVGKTNAVIYKNDSLTQISYARRYSKGTFVEPDFVAGMFIASFCGMSDLTMM